MKKRLIFEENLADYIDTPVIKIIKGVRRSGKSYLLRLLTKALKENDITEDQILYYDFESLRYDDLKTHKALYNEIIKTANERNGKIYLLFDEIQEVVSWEKAIRSFLVDLECDIYITGSNAHMLSSELATHLAGRYIEFEMYPLNFKEFVYFYDVDVHDKGKLETCFNEYLKYGGFPGLYHMPDNDDVKIQYLKGIYNSVVLKDVIQRNRIRDSEILERIITFIFDNIGQLFSGKKVVDYLKAQNVKISIETVYKYIEALENALVIHSAKRYDIKGKKLLQRMDKYYVADLGLRYAALGYRQDDISQILENIVYMTLRSRGYTVYVGKEGDFEVDFIAIKNDEKIYYQVCYLMATETVVEREYRSLLKIKDNYKKVVLSLDKVDFGTREGILWQNLIDFLLI